MVIRQHAGWSDDVGVFFHVSCSFVLCRCGAERG